MANVGALGAEVRRLPRFFSVIRATLEVLRRKTSPNYHRLRGHNLPRKLREVCSSPNDVWRGIASAQACIELLNFGMAKDHLKADQWHAGEAKKVITALGQAQNQKG